MVYHICIICSIVFYSMKIQSILETKDLPTVFPAGDLPGRPSTPVW